MNRSKYSRFVAIHGQEVAVDQEYANKLQKYNSYIQAKLLKLRKSNVPDTNAGIQRHFDSLMRLIIADIDSRLERLSQREDDMLFDDVDDQDDDYITNVTGRMEEQLAIKTADTILVKKL